MRTNRGWQVGYTLEILHHVGDVLKVAVLAAGTQHGCLVDLDHALERAISRQSSVVACDRNATMKRHMRKAGRGWGRIQSPAVSAMISTPPLYFKPNTDVPVTIGRLGQGESFSEEAQRVPLTVCERMGQVQEARPR